MATKQFYTFPAAAVSVPGGLDANIFDSAGNALSSTAGALDVNITGGGGANGSVSAVASPVPGSATYIGARNVSGNLIGLNLSAAAELLVGSATLATEATLAAASAKLPATLGQKAMAASFAVVIASDQSAIPVSGTVTASNPSVGATGAAVPASGTYIAGKNQAGNLIGLNLDASGNLNALPLPTGASTSANQATEIASLASIDGKLVDNFGTASAGLRSAAQIGNATGAADFNAGNKGTQTLRVVIATDQSSLPTVMGANTNGANTDSTVSSVATLTAPANSVGFILMNLDTSTANIRWRIGATATTSAGQQLQAGRDTGYVPCGANISICAESGTQNYNIQWILSS